MNRSRSQLLVYGSMLVLASFLGFWLWQEYELAQEQLLTERHLKLAEGVITNQGEQLEVLMAQLENMGDRSGSIQLSIQLDDTILHKGTDTAHLADLRSTQISIISSDSVPPEYPIHRVHRDTTTSIVMKYINDGAADSEVDFTRVLKSSGELHSPELKRAALLSIWPQALFALALFALLLLGIVLLKRSYLQQQALLEQKNNLISNLTHELKTPVATVSVALEAIQRFNVQQDQEKTSKYLSTSRRELQRLSDTIDMVMQLSILDGKATVFESNHLEADVLLNEVAELMQPQLDAAGMLLSLECANGLTFQADGTHVRNVLVTLIDNAIKYAGTGQEVALSAVDSGSSIQLKITDNGPGIAPADQQHIFDRFFRVTTGNQHNVKGHGLGLSYAKEIVEAHGGTIAVQSPPMVDSGHQHSGTSFIITLPKTAHVTS